MRSLILLICCTLLMSACNKSPSFENLSTQDNHSDKQSGCQTLSAAMKSINSQSKVEQLEAINQQLKNCISQVDNQQQLDWINQSSEMYAQFFNDTENDEKSFTALENYGYSVLEQSPEQAKDQKIKGDLSLFAALSQRDQYLLTNEGKAYIEWQYVGEGIFSYRRQPEYLKDLTAHALPEDQKIFIERMAQDNRKLFMNDAAIQISWEELAERTLFWEDYISKYPKGYFSQFAKDLFEEYRYYLFLGTSNTPVSDVFDLSQGYIDKDALKTIKKLSAQKNSDVRGMAQKFLKFIKVPTPERIALYPTNLKDPDGYDKSSEQIAQEQLIHAIGLASIWDHELKYDCHTDAICLKY